MNCKMCEQHNKPIFKTKILNKYNIEYFYCSNCGFMQTEEAFWLNEAYEESINVSDTGILARNLYLSDISSLIINFFFDKDKKYLDFAGGYGIYTRLMRDIGFDFYWHDKYSTNLLARGFEKDDKLEVFELITVYEAFEHFQNPINEIESMLKISKNILLTTELLPVSVPFPNEWWYYGLEHGQHISFYSLRTLSYIAEKYDLNLYTNGINLHLLTEKNIDKCCFELLFKSNIYQYISSLFNCALKNNISNIKCIKMIFKYRTRKRLNDYVKSSIKSKTVDDMYLIIERMKAK